MNQSKTELKKFYIEKIREAKIVLEYRQTNRRRYFKNLIKTYSKLLDEVNN